MDYALPLLKEKDTEKIFPELSVGHHKLSDSYQYNPLLSRLQSGA